jgi:hypothetical protein
MNPSLSPRLYADLIGKPYLKDARGPAKFDCLGLAIEIQRRMGHTVPEFVSSESELHRQLATGGFLASCTRVDEPKAGCVVLFLMSASEHHIGTMTDRFVMVHTTAQTRGVVREPILGPLWSRRIVGFYQLGEVTP